MNEIQERKIRQAIHDGFEQYLNDASVPGNMSVEDSLLAQAGVLSPRGQMQEMVYSEVSKTVDKFLANAK